MNDDRQPFIIRQAGDDYNSDPTMKIFMGIAAALLIVFVVGREMDALALSVWHTVEPWYLAIFDWRNGVVEWFGGT